MQFKDNQPIYQQIADHFYEKILQRQWMVDQKIPSVRELAVSLEVNPNTAIRAYEKLQQEGILYNKRGVGYYVAPDGYEKVLEVRRQHFRDKVLPELFKQMALLDISIEEVNQLYKVHKNQSDS